MNQSIQRIESLPSNHITDLVWFIIVVDFSSLLRHEASLPAYYIVQ